MFENNNKDFFWGSVADLPYSGLDGKYKNSWVEDSFVFTKKTGKQIESSGTKRYLGSSFTKIKYIYFLGIIFAIFFVIIGRVFFLQILSGGRYSALAERNRARTVAIQSERGIIFDRNGIQLTKNIPKFALAMTPQDLPRDDKERAEVVKKLSELIERTPEEIAEILEQYGNYSYESINILEDLDYETALAVQIGASDLLGIHINLGSKRLYLNDYYEDYDGKKQKFLSLSHILGYEGKLSPNELTELYSKGYLPSDFIGKTGIEKTYEFLLRGEYGYQKIEVDAKGQKQSVLMEQDPVPGHHLTLTLDSEMQKELEKIMTKVLKDNGKTRAGAVAIDPRTGDILALVSLPAFDNNDFAGGIDPDKYREYLDNESNPLFDRVIGGTYPSGSVVKIGIASAALQEGIITAGTTILSSGGLQIGSWIFKDWQADGHGLTDVRKSLAQSVNTFYYYVGGGYDNFTGLGVEKIVQYLKKFGLSSKLGIDLPGESAGFLPSKEWKQKVKNETWYIGDTYNLSIGQGDVLVTPLQIAYMTATVANGGKLFKPKIIENIKDPLEDAVLEPKPEIIDQNFIDRGYLETVKFGMRDCVIYGSCRRLSSLPINIAGKTGTAQWNSNKDNHAWFTSFAPFDSPKIVLTVLVEEGEESTKTAVPIAYEFYNWWGRNY